MTKTIDRKMPYLLALPGGRIYFYVRPNPRGAHIDHYHYDRMRGVYSRTRKEWLSASTSSPEEYLRRLTGVELILVGDREINRIW